jgi:chaperonin GroES
MRKRRKRKKRMTKLLLLEDRILVEPHEDPYSGLIIPVTLHKERPQQGYIRGTGPDVKSSLLKNGDKILFGKFAGNDIKLDGKNMVIIRESDVWSVILESDDE